MIDEIYDMCSAQLHGHKIYKRDHTHSASFISPHNMLVLTLHWLRLYPTFNHLEADYSIPHTTLERMFAWVIQILDATLVPEYILPLSASDPSSSFSRHPDAFLVVDSTFVPIPRPEEQEERHRNYHFKSPTKFALKVQVCCSMNNLIIDVSDVVDGSTADIKLLDHSNVLHQLSPGQVALGDTGYTGKENVRVPLKRNSKARKLLDMQPNITRLQKKHRRELQQQRSVIENINERLKNWHIVGSTYRRDRRDYTQITMIVRVVCALCNMYMIEHPIRV